MADINVERKGPSVWPWIIGLLVLALLIWAIAEMVDTDETQVAEVEEVEPATQPAAVPAPTTQPETAQPVDLRMLMPLGADDAGRTISTRGTVVGQPTSNGHWILTDQDIVLFVVTDQRPSSGASVQVTGRLTPATADQIRTWREQANLQPSAGWTVQEDLFIAPLEQQPTGAAPAQPQPGATPAQPGTTPAQPQPGASGAQQPGATQRTP
ncbi:MAG TPA: hypothetical protein VF192_13985 [Longimicrobiales bacterium]